MKVQVNQGNSISIAVGAPQYREGGSPTLISVILMAITVIDPTGVLTRFSQMIKIVTKLYYININYGARLDTFLSRIGETFMTMKDPDDAKKMFITQSTIEESLQRVQ